MISSIKNTQKWGNPSEQRSKMLMAKSISVLESQQIQAQNKYHFRLRPVSRVDMSHISLQITCALRAQRFFYGKLQESVSSPRASLAELVHCTLATSSLSVICLCRHTFFF